MSEDDSLDGVFGDIPDAVPSPQQSQSLYIVQPAPITSKLLYRSSGKDVITEEEDDDPVVEHREEEEDYDMVFNRDQDIEDDNVSVDCSQPAVETLTLSPSHDNSEAEAESSVVIKKKKKKKSKKVKPTLEERQEAIGLSKQHQPYKFPTKPIHFDHAALEASASSDPSSSIETGAGGDNGMMGGEIPKQYTKRPPPEYDYEGKFIETEQDVTPEQEELCWLCDHAQDVNQEEQNPRLIEFNEHINDNYHEMEPVALAASAQEQWNTRIRHTQKGKPFYSKRKILEHVEDHAPKTDIMLEKSLRVCNRVMTILVNKGIFQTDQENGWSIDTASWRLYMSTMDKRNSLIDKLCPIRCMKKQKRDTKRK